MSRMRTPGKLSRKQRREINRERHAERAAEMLAERKRMKERVSELRKDVPYAAHEALIRRRELFTDEEASEELGCTMEELLALEKDFLGELRRKWLRLGGWCVKILKDKRMEGVVREEWDAW